MRNKSKPEQIASGMRIGLLRWVLFAALWMQVGKGIIFAQGEAALRIAQLDTSGFPLIHVNLITAGPQSAPLTDLSSLSLRENGIPIGDLELQDVEVGVNLIFVIDLNATMEEIDDDSGLTRLEKVKRSITRYASQYMTDGDQVTIVIPDDRGQSGSFLLEDGVRADQVKAAIESYDPEIPGRTPLDEMMLLALAHAADDARDGRFQALLLFTDAAQLRQQLSYATVVARAQGVPLPLYMAIVGERADPNEIENVAGLHEPTQATYVHMAEETAADPIFEIWRRQRVQTQVSYRSLQTRSGRYPITVNLGSARAMAEYTLALAPPEILLVLEDNSVQRVGDAPDTPLEQLNPVVHPVRVKVQWPDQLPRGLIAANLFVDGQVQRTPSSLALDSDDGLLFDWNIASLDDGQYALVAQVTDELGMTAVSEAVMVTVVVERPLPPTPTVAPTTTPEANEAGPEEGVIQPGLLVTLTAVGVAAALPLFFLRRRRSLSKGRKEKTPATGEASKPEAAAEPTDLRRNMVYLEVLDAAPTHVSKIRIEGDSVSIGRDHTLAQIVFTDESVSGLHARIRRRDNRYWLYDEGSTNGTFHNYERLGLTPRPLENQDMIRFGHVKLRFHLIELEIDSAMKQAD